METIDLGPIKNKDENNNLEDNKKDNTIKDNEKENQNNNIINKNEKEEEEDDNKNNNIENKEENTNKVQIDLSNDNSKNNKISFCHFILPKGIDIDITKKKDVFFCFEKIKNKTFFSAEKYSKMQTIILFDEHYLYLLKNNNINKTNSNLRRIKEKFDLNKLFDYNIQKKSNKFEFALDFLIEQNFLDRKMKYLLFEEKEAENFENHLLETLEKIDSIFINEGNEENEEEEEEEEENDNKKEELKNENANEEKKENEFKVNDKKEKGNNKKIVLRNIYGFGERKESADAKSSSRFLYKNAYV